MHTRTTFRLQPSSWKMKPFRIMFYDFSRPQPVLSSHPKMQTAAFFSHATLTRPLRGSVRCIDKCMRPARRVVGGVVIVAGLGMTTPPNTEAAAPAQSCLVLRGPSRYLKQAEKWLKSGQTGKAREALMQYNAESITQTAKSAYLWTRVNLSLGNLQMAGGNLADFEGMPAAKQKPYKSEMNALALELNNRLYAYEDEIDHARQYSLEGHYEQALSSYNKALTLDSTDGAEVMSRGNIYTQLGMYELAMNDYKTALRRGYESSETYAGMGWTHYLAGRPEEARAALDRAISLDRTCMEAYLYRGMILHEQDSMPEALRDLNRALQLRPTEPDALYARGEILLHMGRPKEAIKDLNELVDLIPDYDGALELRAECWTEMGQYGKAIDDYTLHLKDHSEDAEARNARGLVYCQMALAGGDKFYLAAIRDFKAALEVEPAAPEFHANLAFALREVNRYKEARAAYMAAISIDSLFLDAYVGLATTEMLSGKNSDAVKVLTTAIAIWPEEAELYYYRAQANHAAGKKRAAKDDMAKALQFGWAEKSIKSW